MTVVMSCFALNCLALGCGMKQAAYRTTNQLSTQSGQVTPEGHP
jgi:hypothetical protein